MKDKKRFILAITGASGTVYGVRMLQALQELDAEVHLVITQMGAQVLEAETGQKSEDIRQMAAFSYRPTDLAASIASGSFHTDGMLVVPCSIKTLSGIANSYAENLVQRAADVCLKEGRPLLLAVRETPLHLGHIRLMEKAAQSGAVIFPPNPAFYNRPETIEQVVDETVGRMLSRLGVQNKLYRPWNGTAE
jgi:4-hydroxy-3-polyprenylbenzoate decarboxylase